MLGHISAPAEFACGDVLCRAETEREAEETEAGRDVPDLALQPPFEHVLHPRPCFPPHLAECRSQQYSGDYELHEKGKCDDDAFQHVWNDRHEQLCRIFVFGQLLGELRRTGIYQRQAVQQDVGCRRSQQQFGN